MFPRKVLEREKDVERVRGHLQEPHDHVITLLGLEFLYWEYWAVGFTDDLTQTITRNILEAELNWAAVTPEKSLAPVFDRLCVLRNQALHGSATFGSIKNRDSLKPAVPVLERLVKSFRDIVAADERDARWGLPPNVPKGWTSGPGQT